MSEAGRRWASPSACTRAVYVKCVVAWRGWAGLGVAGVTKPPQPPIEGGLNLLARERVVPRSPARAQLGPSHPATQPSSPAAAGGAERICDRLSIFLNSLFPSLGLAGLARSLRVAEGGNRHFARR